MLGGGGGSKNLNLKEILLGYYESYNILFSYTLKNEMCGTCHSYEMRIWPGDIKKIPVY